MSYFLLIIAGYLFGSISMSIVVAKLLNLEDPRTVGSKNPGATNMVRLAGKKWGAMVLIFDVFKGMLPVYLTSYFLLPIWTIVMTAAATFLGHLYPIFFKFKGGKGVAVSLGILLVISWQVLLCVVATWLLVLCIARYVSLASIIASFSLPIWVCFWQLPWYTYGLLALFMACCITWRHRSNAKRILAGTESKLF